MSMISSILAEQTGKVKQSADVLSDPRSTVRVLSSVKGEGPLIATVDVKVGGLLIRRVKVRRGRNNFTYVDFPSVRDNETGKWIHYIEFSSKALEEFVRANILQAVLGQGAGQ